MKKCINCNEELVEGNNFCDWECQVDYTQRHGGKVITPNNLPIKCINNKGMMLECEHGDHPDYKFPIEVDYIGEPYIHEEEWMNEIEEAFNHELHAMIYCDGRVVLTLHECSYSMFSLRTGRSTGGFCKPNQWKISDLSLEKIRSKFK